MIFYADRSDDFVNMTQRTCLLPPATPDTSSVTQPDELPEHGSTMGELHVQHGRDRERLYYPLLCLGAPKRGEFE